MNAGNFAAKTKAALTSIDESKLTARNANDGDPIVKFYQYAALGPKAGPKSAQFAEGDKIVGTYKGSYTKTREITLKTGKKKTITETKYLIATDEGTVAVQGTGPLSRDMDAVVKGAQVALTNEGEQTAKNGNNFYKIRVVASEWAKNEAGNK